jgi:hypothetical protein
LPAEALEFLRRRGKPMKQQLLEDIQTLKDAEGPLTVCCGRKGHPCGTVIKDGDPTRVSHGLCVACYDAEMAALDRLEAGQAEGKRGAE